MKHRLVRPWLIVVALFFFLSGSVPSYAGTQKTKSSGKSGSSAESGEKAKSNEKKEKKPAKTVHVEEYTRKDGTKVKAHDRRTSGAAKDSGSGSSTTPTSSRTAPALSGPRTSGTKRSDRCENCDRDADGRIVRSGKAKKQFEKATGYPKGRPGYVIDHIVPLACGGQDVPSNMQWQTKADAKSKDKTERAHCHFD
jgi:hypothetical protein